MTPETTGYKFSIIVIGAGIGGCATALGLARRGHSVTVLEVREELSELGAGLQISPNGARVLCHWGLRERFEKHVCRPSWVQYRAYDTGEMLGKHPRNVDGWYEDIYGAPLWTIYRPDYQRILAEEAQRLDVQFYFSSKVFKVDAVSGSVHLSDGRVLQADVVVGADAIPSCAEIETIVWEEYAYRGVVDRNSMLSCPSTRNLSEEGNTNFFLGPAGILLSYPCARGELFNVVAPCRRSFGQVDLDDMNPQVNSDTLVEEYREFSSPVPELLHLVKKCVKWTIAYLPILPTYSTDNGRVVLVGDAAHAMLPAAASASNAAIEDAAALSECISVCKAPEDMPHAVRAYEAIRKPRNDRIWQISMVSQRNVSSYTAASYEVAVKSRNEGLRKTTDELEEHLRLQTGARKLLQSKVIADEAAVYPSPPVLKWLYGYDSIAASEEYLRLYSTTWPSAQGLADGHKLNSQTK